MVILFEASAGSGVPTAGRMNPSNERGMSDWFRIPLKGREDWPSALYDKGYNEVFFHGVPFPCLPAFLKTGVLLPSTPHYGEIAYTSDKNKRGDNIVHG
eukprot:12918477-Prorocentrum_lima.AAC.1